MKIQDKDFLEDARDGYNKQSLYIIKLFKPVQTMKN